jgi:hypothetical protein
MANRETYRSESLSDSVFDRRFIGRDEAGRDVYEVTLDGHPWGGPRALLTFREFVLAVKAASRISPSLGVQRWTDPFGEIRTNKE